MPHATAASTVYTRLLEIPAHDFIRLLQIVPREELARIAAPHFTPSDAQSWTPRIQVLKGQVYAALGVDNTKGVRAIALERGWIAPEEKFTRKEIWLRVQQLAQGGGASPVPTEVALEDLSLRQLRRLAAERGVPGWTRLLLPGGGGKAALVAAIRAHKPKGGKRQR